MTGPTLKGCRCQCPACGEYFGSERAFDRHRVGEYEVPGRASDSRLCLTLRELLSAGWHRSVRGFLLTPDPRRAGADKQGALQTEAAMGLQGPGGGGSPA